MGECRAHRQKQGSVEDEEKKRKLEDVPVSFIDEMRRMD